MVKVGVVKTGNIGTSLVLELLLDERADREDIDVRVVTSGAKMGASEGEDVVSKILEFDPDLILYSTPNPAAPGPMRVVDKLAGKNAIVFGDSPGIRVKDKLDELGLGYVFVKADSMIGARREFLDPTEMIIFNSDMIKILAVTGVIRLIQEEVDRVIDEIKENKSLSLPRIIVDAKTAVSRSGIVNPEANAKAIKAFEMAEKVGEIDVKACFMIKDPAEYIPLVDSAHKLLRDAARLAEEARDIERAEDNVLRTPHSKSGKILKKRRLLEKPES